MSDLLFRELHSINIDNDYIKLINKFLSNNKGCFFDKKDFIDTYNYYVITDTDFGDIVLNEDGISTLRNALSGGYDSLYETSIVSKIKSIYNFRNIEDILSYEDEILSALKRYNITAQDFLDMLEVSINCYKLDSELDFIQNFKHTKKEYEEAMKEDKELLIHCLSSVIDWDIEGDYKACCAWDDYVSGNYERES